METTRHAPQSLLRPMRAVLRWGLVAGVVGIALGMLVGYLIDGAPGSFGALLGLGSAVVFFSITVGVALATARLQPQALGMAVLASWLLKMIGLIALLVVLRSQDFYSKPIFFFSLLFGTFGYLALEAVIVSRTKVLYVETEFAPERGA